MMSHVSSKTSLMAQVLGSSLGQYLTAGSVPFSLAEESFGFLEEQDFVVFENKANSPLYGQGPESQEAFFCLRRIMAWARSPPDCWRALAASSVDTPACEATSFASSCEDAPAGPSSLAVPPPT